MLKFVLISAGVLIASSAFAQTRSYYDWQSGNSYSVHRNSNGATINGYNTRTGSMWNQRQNSNGTYSGMDAQGNHYSGNNRTGSYYNYGTGKMCTGTGYARVCN